MSIWLVEITDYSGGSEVIRRFASEGYVTKPDDAPANTHYQPRVQIPANYSRTIRGEGGRASVGSGEVVLANPDGALDGLFDAIDGRALRVLTVEPGAAYSTATVVLRATMEQAEYSWRRVRIKLRDRVAELAERKVQTNVYAGTTTSGGVKDAEGRPEDIGGRPKPLCFGKVYHVPAPCVDVFNPMWQVNDGSVVSITAYDRGVAIPAGVDHATLAALYTATVAPGTCDTCCATGHFRLGTDPAGVVTADVVQGATAADRTAAQIMLALADIAGVTDIDSAAFTALDTVNSAELGLWLDTETDIASAMDRVAQSVGAWWGFDRLGNLTCGRMEAPAGTAAATYTAVEILDRGQQGLERISGDVPAWRVNLRYRPNWYVFQAAEVDGTAANLTALTAELSQAWRTVTSTDATVQTTHLLAPDIERESLIADATAAQTEADRLLALHKVRRDRYRVPVPTRYAEGIDLGNIVSIKVPRFGLAAGALAQVVGITENAETSVTELEVVT